jgi:hypothetical protein
MSRLPVFAMAVLALVSTLIPPSCRGVEEDPGHRSADQRPETSLPPADAPSDKILSLRVEATPLDRGATVPLEAAAGLATGTAGPPLDRNGLALTWGGPRYAEALAGIVERHAGAHDVQLITMKSGHAARAGVNPPQSGHFRFWGEWEGETTDGGEIEIDERYRGLAVWARYRPGGDCEVALSPALLSPEPDVGMLEVTALSTRIVLPPGGAVLLATSGDLGERTFGQWFLSRRAKGSAHPIFVVLYLHCLN